MIFIMITMYYKWLKLNFSHLLLIKKNISRVYTCYNADTIVTCTTADYDMLQSNFYKIVVVHEVLYIMKAIPQTTIPQTTIPQTTIPQTTMPQTTIPQH